MLNRIKEILEKTLKENIDNNLKESVGEQKKIKFPSIAVENISFEFSEIGVGRKIEPENKIIEFFNGDNENKNFKLKELPLKPSITIEYPINNQLNENQFDIDYLNGIIKLKEPPKKGEKNIKITYIKPIEIRGIKMNMIYHINILAEDEKQRDEISMKVVEIFLKNEEELNSQEIYIKPIKGYNFIPDNTTTKSYGKKLEYLIESDLEIPIPSSRIEKVEISKPIKIS